MRSFILLILLTAGLTSKAQTTGSISGKINTAEIIRNNPPAFTVTIYTRDSVAVKSLAVDKEGNFEFTQIPFGNYFLLASGSGYHPKYTPPINLDASRASVVVSPIVMQPAANSLEGITVTAQKQMIEQKADRMVVNVGASITNEGSSALEVLEKSPGIIVEKDGSILIRGKAGAQVYLDGRPVQLDGQELLNYLRSLNASQLDQLEIMTNPPARYDATGSAGIINIKTKKIKSEGFNGTANANYTQGRYAKTSEAFQFNYRRNRTNFFTSINHNYWKGFEKMTIQRRIIDPATGGVQHLFDQLAMDINRSNSFNGRFGIDFQKNRNTAMGFSLSGALSQSQTPKNNTAAIADKFGNLQLTTQARVYNENKWRNFSANAYYRKVLDSSGREISTDLDFVRYGSAYNQLLVNSYNYGSGFNQTDSLEGDLPQDVQVYSVRVDYLHPLGKGARFEAGVKSGLVRTDNDARYDSIMAGQRVYDKGRSNHFIYEENINAAYTNLNSRIGKKLDLQLGLRMEHTRATGRQLTTGIDFTRNYLQLFPTAYVQYKLADKHVLGLNTGRRIRRPNYSSLNPFIRFIDRYTYSKGNPDLRPQISQQIEFSHSYNNFLFTTISYSHTKDMLQTVIEQRGQDAYAMQSNLASMKQLGISVSINRQVTKAWSTSFFTNLSYNEFRGLINNDPVIINGLRMSVNGMQQFKLNKTLTAEISGQYRTSGVQGVLRTKAMGGLNLGFSKQVMKNNGTIRLNAKDIFFTMRRQALAQYSNVDAAFQEIGDSRTITIGFSYRFSKGKAGAQKKKNTGVEEMDRISN